VYIYCLELKMFPLDPK